MSVRSAFARCKLARFCSNPSTEPMPRSWLPQTATLRCVAVDPAFHGFGFSERLLVEADEIVRLWGLKGICLHVVNGALGVGRLYERHGYLRDRRGDRDFLGGSLMGYVRPLSADYVQAIG